MIAIIDVKLRFQSKLTFIDNLLIVMTNYGKKKIYALNIEKKKLSKLQKAI
jgi:hypothetical protein